MSLYDQVQQANTPYMSQFVGSIVPELNQYSQAMQQRYNTATDTDDMLAEGLGNLQHLNFDADTQYANELKQQYYQRLNDRASRGDFENMGRRTRLDAMRFSQAYQPLIQRQKDYAEIVKKVQSDPNIADPDKKQQILQYISHMNTTPRSGSDYQRDQNGRVQLGGIQDWAYAPDVDINKKLVDLLSKKEADVRAGRYFSDGHGNLVNTVEKVRDPRYMSELADQMMRTDPEIKAMINRDTTLQTYNLSPDDVRKNLSSMGLDKSAYTQLRSKGMNDHEAKTYIKSHGNLGDGMTSPLDATKASLMSSGMSEEAAEKSILSNQIKEGMMSPHANFVGGLLGYKQETTDHMTDHIAVLHAQAALANMKDPNLMLIQGMNSTPSQENPVETAKQHVASTQDLQTNAQSVQSAILAGLKSTGMSSGNPKQDISDAVAMMHNPVKLNALKVELAKTHPQEAQVLESIAAEYNNKAAIVQAQSNHVNDLEKAGGWDWDKKYQEYVKAKSGRSVSNIFDSHIKSKTDYMNAVRTGKLVTPDDFTTIGPTGEYKDAVNKGMKAMNDGIAQGAGYTMLEPTGSGKAAALTDAVTNLVINSRASGIDLNKPTSGPSDIVTSMGLDPRSKDFDKEVKNLQVRFNTEGVNGKPTITASLNGTSKVFQLQNMPQGLQDELNLEVVKAGASANTTDYGRTKLKQGLIGFGTSVTPDITAQYLKTVNPGASGVLKSLSDKYAVKVKDAGAGNRRYELYRKMPDGTTKPMGVKFDSVDDLFGAIGQERMKEVTPVPTQTQLNRQR